MKKRKFILAKLLCAVLAISLTAGAVSSVELKEVKAHDIPAYQQKDVFATETVKIQGITVEKVVNDTVSPVITSTIQEPVKFVIYNSTKQTVEQRVESENGMLPELNLVKNHNYIIFAEDSKYRMPNVYIWVNGNRIVDIKKNVDPDTNTYDYPEVKSLLLYERDSEEPNPEGTNRVFINLPVRYGDGPMANVRFKLVSAVETVEAVTTNSGQLRADILEDITYMVVADNEQYAVEPLALAAKDKSEYGAGRYAYNHADCNRIDTIQLVDKKDAHKNDITVTSISGKTAVTGMNFRDFLVLDKELDSSLVTGLENREYTVLDIKVVNPHRWEVSKLAAGEYPVTVKIDKNRTVTNVYYLDGENQLCPLEFKQKDNRVFFTMSTLSMYPVVIEYEPGGGEPDPGAGEWRYDSIGWWYRHADGSYSYNRWELIGGEWYYFNASGYRVTGWQRINGTWYYFDTDGMMLADEWVDNGNYYVTSGGAMATGWLQLAEGWYYLNGSGAKVTGWIRSGNSWYYMDPATGIMHAGEWVDNGNYYVTSSGAMATGWLQLAEGWYYLDGSGAKVRGWQRTGGSWYYLDATTGIMHANEWVDNGNYYVTSSGAMTTGWLQLAEGWYYLNSNGAKVTSQWVGNYYLKADGIMAISEWVDNDRYFVDENGAWVPGATKS